MPRLEQIYQESGGDFEIVAIHMPINKQDLERWMAKTGRHFSFPIAIDTSSSVPVMYEVPDTDTAFFVDRQGILQAWHSGLWGPMGEEKIRGYLKSIL